MQHAEEAKLIRKAQGDSEYFGEIYEKHFDRIFNYVFRRVADFDLARDITSEVFMKAYLNLWQFRWKGISIGAWFYRIATNEVNLYFRKNKYKATTVADLGANRFLELVDPVSLEAEKAEAERLLKENEDFIRIQKIIVQMEPKYQEVLALRYFEQKPVTEICEILSKKEGTVKSLISRGLDKIRTRIKLSDKTAT